VVKGVLEISGQSDSTGAPMNDNISLSQSGTTITVVENGVSYPVSTTGLTGILIDAGAGSDFVALATASGKSTINLGATILGGKGDDVLLGGNGNDSLVGGFGNDKIVGNAGNDYLNGGLEAANSDADGTDTILGGTGEDAVLYTYRTTPLTITLDGVADSGAVGENDLIGSDVEDAFGGRGNDSIVGNASRNYLSGGTGSDTLRGGAGNDILNGSCVGDGSDSLYGDQGIDAMLMAGDKVADHYDVGPGEIESALFVSKDVAPGGGFLDTPI
jgi:Ca2+-binding RTX toxin-like protein